MARNHVGWLRLVVGTVCLFALSLVATAQSPQGSIIGTVTDSQGSSIPGAEVVARNLGTNLPYRATTGQDGSYTMLALPIGDYEVSASVAGFKAFRRSGIRLEVAQRLRLDIGMELGQVTELVEVRADIARVQTEDSSLGTVVESKRIAELPLNGRHVFNLVKIVAGVQPRDNSTDGFAEISNQGFSQMRINGGPAYGNQFFLDGAVNSVPVHNEIAVVPPADAVEEFKVETNALKAEYGQTSGGVVNVVTKSGTNELKGSLYEFLRNDSLDARNAFATQPNAQGRIKQVLRYNQFGGTVGGPLFIPKFYDGRNRTFWFVGYEQWRWRSTGNPRFGTVATQEQRNGDFSNTRDSLGRVIPVFDPATTTALPTGGFSRTPFANNRVPQGRFDPLSARVMPFMPLPNATPTDPFTFANNFVALVPSSSDQGVTNMRVDHRISESDQVFFRYSVTRNTRQDRGWGLGPADPNARNDQRDNHSAVVGYTKVITPNTLNDFRVSVARQWLPFEHPSFDQNWPQQLGYPSIIPQDQFPPVAIAGLLQIGSPSFSAGVRAQNYLQIANGTTFIRGNHTIKAGFDLRWSRLSFINRFRPSGNFNFAANMTNNPVSPAGNGFGLASFLLGEVSSGDAGFRPFFQFRALPLGTYIQDDWRITRNFTLNIGLRHDISFGPTEIHDRHSNFDPFITNPDNGFLGVMTYKGVGSEPRSFVNLDKNNFGPRIGFAWNPGGTGKTAIRGGYGRIFTISEIGHTQGDNTNAFGFSIDTPFASSAPGIVSAFRFSDGPTTLLQPLGASGGPSAFRGFTVRYQDRVAPTPDVQHWNFTVQQALWGGWVASAVYAGSKGTHLFGGNYDLNQLDPAFWSQGLALQQNVANPFQGQISSGPLAGATVQRQQLLRPFPDYQTVQTFAAPNASSSFHSFQAIIEKRFSAGLSALISYTGSKLITDALSVGGGGNATGLEGFRMGRFNRDLDRRVDQDDVSQRLVVSSVFELPFGKGRKFLTGAPTAVDLILGGWQMNGIGTFQTGRPLMVRGANNFTGIGFPDLVADPSLPSGERSANRWFNTDAFRNPADFVLGNAPFTLPSTRGPGLTDLSFSLFKTFSFLERFRLETRWEMFNALNTVNLNNPNTTFTPNPQGINTNANFGRIFGALEARRMQVGMRLTF
ncbi:MAG: carboxypeptidase regulatory-like domain-containing protein [Bryobacterales bacterium]|nr:carboxypeptidase regulatory-like domain-containing protein [Bryobacterales bacterium]